MIGNPVNICGLVLAGGKSLRMGKDKGLIDYHGMPQREYVAGLLAGFCSPVFISARKGQVDEKTTAFPILEDKWEGLGPFAALLTAFDQNPKAAWLVLACDIPLLDKQVVATLVESRDPGMSATAYKDPVSGLPEPLIAIWEPQILTVLRNAFEKKMYSPRQILKNSPVKLIDPKDPWSVKNVNTVREYREIISHKEKGGWYKETLF